MRRHPDDPLDADDLAGQLDELEWDNEELTIEANDLRARCEHLEDMIGAAYQLIGDAADRLGVFEHPETVLILDAYADPDSAAAHGEYPHNLPRSRFRWFMARMHYRWVCLRNGLHAVRA